MISFTRGALLALAALSGVTFLVLGAMRLVYPLELDCIEGVMMDHVVRVAQGLPIYTEPSLEFISLAYMPLFSVLSGLLAKVFGPGLWEPRLISLLAVFGAVALIVRIIKSETTSWTLAAGGGALYLMGFAFTGSCYDVARPDSLMIFLGLAGLATLRFTTGRWGAIGAGLLLVLAFFAKQHAVWFVAAATLHLAFNERWRLLTFGLVAIAGSAVAYLALASWLGPWFTFYTWELPSRWSQLSPRRIFNFVGLRVLGTLGLLVAPVLVSLGMPARPWRGRDGLWAWFGLAAVGSGLMATLDPSTYAHTLMPLMAALAILGPISLHRLTQQATTNSVQANFAGGIACGVLVLQFLPLAYAVRGHMPHPRANEAHREFVADLKRHPGHVLVPYHGFYEWSAGKGSSLHIIALDDILRARGNRLLREDPRFFERLFATLKEGADRPAIVTDVPLAQSGPLWASLEGSYTLSRELGWISEPLRPVSGNRFTPTYVYLPREGTNAAGVKLPGAGPMAAAPEGAPGAPDPPVAGLAPNPVAPPATP